jgi:hypothetical protein
LVETEDTKPSTTSSGSVPTLTTPTILSTATDKSSFSFQPPPSATASFQFPTTKSNDESNSSSVSTAVAVAPSFAFSAAPQPPKDTSTSESTVKSENEMPKQPFSFGAVLVAPSLPTTFGSSFQSLTKDKVDENKDKQDLSISLKAPISAASPVLDSSDRKDFAKELDSPTINQGKPPVIPSASHASIPFGIAFGSLKGDKPAPFSPSSSQRQEQQSQQVPAFTFGASQPNQPQSAAVPPAFTFGGINHSGTDNSKTTSASVAVAPSFVFGGGSSTQQSSVPASVQTSTSAFSFTAGQASSSSQPSIMFGGNNNPTSAGLENKPAEQSSTGFAFSSSSNPLSSSFSKDLNTAPAVPSFTPSTTVNNAFQPADQNKPSFTFGGGNNTFSQAPAVPAFGNSQNSSSLATANPFSGNSVFPSLSNQPQQQQVQSSAFGGGNQSSAPFTSSGVTFQFSGGSTSISHLSNNEQKPSAFPAFGAGSGSGLGPFSSAANSSSSNLSFSSTFGTSGKESPNKSLFGGGFGSTQQTLQQPQQTLSLPFSSGNQQAPNLAPFGNQTSSLNPFGQPSSSSTTNQPSFGQQPASTNQTTSFAFGGNNNNNNINSGQAFQFGAGGGMGANLTGNKPFQVQQQQTPQFGGSGNPFGASSTQPSSNNPSMFASSSSSTTQNTTTGPFGGSMNNTGSFQQQQQTNSGFPAFGNSTASTSNPFGSSTGSNTNSMFGTGQQQQSQMFGGNNSNSLGGFGAGNASTNSLQSFGQFGGETNTNNNLVSGPSLFAAGKADIPRTTSFRGGRQRGARK